MFIYEKNKKLYGTNTTPSANDNEVVYKDQNNTIITLNENDKYFDNGAGGMTRQSDGKTVDMLFDNKYVIPRGKEAPPVPSGTVITWDGNTAGKEIVTLSDCVLCKVSDKFVTNVNELVGGSAGWVEGTEHKATDITSEIVEEIIPNKLILVGDIVLIPRETVSYLSETFTAGTWFLKANDDYYASLLSYGD